VKVERFPMGKASSNKDELWISASKDPHAFYAIVTMDDVKTLNSLTPPMMIQLHDAILNLTRDPTIKVVIVTGTGAAFCSGGDLHMIAEGARSTHETVTNPITPGGGTTVPWRWIRQQFGGVARLISNSNAVFVAAVNGVAAGVGLAFAMACDMIIVSENARIVPAFGRLGLVPEVGTSYMLTRKLGYQGAFNFFIQGKHVTGAEALKMGLCQQCVPHDKLMDAAKQWVYEVAQMPSHALEMTKTLLRAVGDVNFESSLRLEEFAEANCFSTRALPLSAEAILAKTSSKL
jgi:2-(1,2-epoxy-1,2-dihydrophenyl)acetyl-CoA isomerase